MPRFSVMQSSCHGEVLGLNMLWIATTAVQAHRPTSQVSTGSAGSPILRRRHSRDLKDGTTYLEGFGVGPYSRTPGPLSECGLRVALPTRYTTDYIEIPNLGPTSGSDPESFDPGLEATCPPCQALGPRSSDLPFGGRAQSLKGNLEPSNLISESCNTLHLAPGFLGPPRFLRSLRR